MASRIKMLIGAVIGFIVGVLFTAILGWNMMPGMMLNTAVSPHDFDTTVSTIEENARAEGWKVPKIYNFQKSIMDDGYDDVGRIKVLELCQPEYAEGLLKDDASKRVSVLMPCAIAVYETGDGEVHISSMNAGLMGKMFGGNVADAMGKVSADDAKILDFAE